MELPKLKLPLRCLLAGSSSTGKTSLVQSMLQHQEYVFEKAFTKILLCHSAPDKNYNEMAASLGGILEIHDGLPTDFLENPETYIKDGDNTLVILDVLLQSIAASALTEKLFYCLSSHYRISVILCSQNIFCKSPKLRNISLNCNVIILTANPRDETQVQLLSRQLNASNPKFVLDAYKKTIKAKPYNYLVIDLHPTTDPKLKVGTGILPGEDRIYFQPSSA
jgi:hypothetical protein